MAAIATNDKATIRAKLRALCPVPLRPAELKRAAAYVETHPDAFPVINDLDRLDRESRIYRGEKS